MNIYRDEIIEHFNDPLNFGKLAKFDLSAKQTNPFCGDDIEMFIKVKKDEMLSHRSSMTIVEDISFVGRGCAISIAAASILTEFVKTKSLEDLTQLQDSDMMGLLKIDVSETRKKCALLALATLKDSLGTDK